LNGSLPARNIHLSNTADMPISVGDRLPEATLFLPGESGPQACKTGELFAGRKVVLVGMPGAFTPTCHRNHLPGFVENRDAILAKGIDEIIVLSTNDVHVLRAWAEASGAKDRLLFVSDGNAEFIGKAGLANDSSGRGMGIRSKRFAMIVDDGVLTSVAVEEAPGQATVSAAAQILAQL
jgi:glutaredoxin/glutathione-dependent peroxiredoxin